MRGQTNDQSLLKNGIRPILTGAVSGILCSVLLLFLFSLLVSMGDIPQSAIDPMAIFALCAGAFLSGFLCTRITRGGGLAYGAICGLILSAVVILGGLVSGAAGIGVPALFRVVFILLCAMIGGVLGVNVRKRRR